MQDMARREWLGVLAGAATAGLAGCASDDEPGRSTTTGTSSPVPTTTSTAESTDGPAETLGGDGELPPYASWLDEPDAAPAGEPEFFVSVDLELLYEHDRRRRTVTPTPGSTPSGERPTDPLLHNPYSLFVGAFFGLMFDLHGTGLERLVDVNETPESEDPPADTLLSGGGPAILSGSFERAALAADLAENGFVEVEPLGAYDVYYDDTDDGLVRQRAIAFTDEHVLVDSASDEEDPLTELRESLGRAIETDDGARTRYHDANEGVEWLLRTAGQGDIVTGAFTEDEGIAPTDEESGDGEEPVFQFDEDIYTGARGVVHGLQVDLAERVAEARGALLYADAERADTDRLESFVGEQADERSFDRQDEKVVVEATYRDGLPRL